MADSIDYTNAFGDVQRGFLAAQSVVKSTRAGKDGLIRVVIDANQQVKFFSPIANESFDSFAKALAATRGESGEFITSLDVFSAGESPPGSLNVPGLGRRKIPAPFAEDRSGAGRQIFRDMVNRISNLSADDKKILLDAGIDVDDFARRGQMFQATFTLDDETIFKKASIAKSTSFDEKDAKYTQVLDYIKKLFASEDTGLPSNFPALGQGIQVLDSDSSLKVIGFRLASPEGKNIVNFNSYQANLLVSVLGNNFLNPEVFDKIFSVSDPSIIKVGSSSAFSKKALKISKRLRAAFGDRPISLAGDDLNSAISQALAMEAGKSPKVGKVKKINHSLSDHVLVTDFEFEVMRNWAFDDKMDNMVTASGKALRGKEERALYKNLKSGNYVDSVIGFFTGDPTKVSQKLGSRKPATADAISADQLDILKAAIRDVVTSDRGGKGHIKAYDKSSGRFGSKVLMDELAVALGGKKYNLQDDEIKKLTNVARAMMRQAELAKDGADIINARFLRAQVTSLDSNIQEIESILKDPSLNLDSSEKALLKDKLENIKRSRRSFQSAIDHGGQVTGRISVGGMSTAKDIVSVSELVDDLKDIFFILNKTSFKEETGIAGTKIPGIVDNVTEFINLSGMVSDYADNVKIDYAAAAAHGSIFATEEHHKAARQRADILMSELDDALNNNYFSPRIRSILDRVSSSDAAELYEDMSDFARIAATKAKEQARIINEYIQRGGNVSENVEIANALFDIVGREIYRYDSSKNEAKVVMANVYRFGLDSEAGLLGRTKKKITNKGEVYQASEIFLGGKNGVVDRQIVSDIMVGGESFDLSEEIIKFRIADHKILLSEDAVARYMHALGGFDLDDKGLPIITRFQTSSGVEKLAFNLLRQPTGPEESMFLLPNFDAETVRSLLSRDEMRYALENLQGEFSDFSQASGIFDRMTEQIQSRGINRFDFDLTDPLAGYKVREEFGRSMRLLTSIMEGDGSIGGLYNYEDQSKLAQNVEQAMLDLLRYAELREFTTVSDVSRRQARKISRFGTSSLMSPPGVEEVGYTSEGIFKLLDREGVFDPTESMIQALRQAGYDDDFINRFTNYTDPLIQEGMEKYSPFDSKMKFLAQNVDDQNKLSALIATAIGFHGAKNIQTKGGGELGTYINSSMVVSSMLDQYQDFLFDVNKTHRKKMKTVYNKLLEYNIGLISQETAIDIAVNQGGLRSLDREKVRIATLAQLSEGGYNPFLDQKKLGEVINRLHGSADLKTLNEEITPGIIKQTAFVRTLSDAMGMGYDGGYGFDYDLFQSRMLKDPKKMVDYMGTYANEAQEAFKFAEGLGFEVSASQRELIDKMKSLYLGYQNAGKQDRAAKLDEITKFMRYESGMFLAGARAKEYGHVSKFNKLSTDLQGDMATKRREAYNQNMLRQKAKIDSALSNITKESRVRAQDIIERYSDDLLRFKQVRIADLFEDQVESDVLRRFEVMDNLYKEIADNSRLENISRFDILTALDSVLLDQKIDIAAGKMLPQIEGANAMSEMIRSISSARSLRDIRQAINNDIAGIGGELFQKFSSLTESYGGETFAERLQNYVDANTKRGIIIGLNDMEERMIRRFLSGNADTEEVSQLRRLSRDALSDAGQAASEFLAQDSAIYGSFAARAQYLDNQAEFEELIKYGTAESEAELAQEMGEDFEEFRARDVEVKKTQYKRISDKIREAEFIDFIKKPAVKKTLYGMAALIGASFGYQAYKDRTHSDMQGPPLLPGGSAYEVRPGQGSYNLENVYNQGYSPGVSYQVSLHGDQNSINNFRQSVGDLNYGNLTTTMYSNLPRLNRDLYADVAPDF